MSVRVHFEYDYCMVTPLSDWRRSRFSYRPEVFGRHDDPGGDEEATAREMLIVLAQRYRTGTRFRLVRITEEVFDDPALEVVSPIYD